MLHMVVGRLMVKVTCTKCNNQLQWMPRIHWGLGFIGFFLFIMLLFHWGQLEAAYLGILADWAENGFHPITVIINNG